jgi:hypothetical protein
VKNMYCKKCGKELEEGAEFCPGCGASLVEGNLTYRKQGSKGWDAGRVIAVVFGGFMILVGLPLAFAGTALMGVTSAMDDGSGYIGVWGFDFETGTQALVFKEMHVEDIVINRIESPAVRYWTPRAGDFIKLKFALESNNGKDVFIGIMDEAHALSYLGGAEYETVTDFKIDSPFDGHPYITYQLHSGGDITVAPQDMSAWDAYATGEDINLEWEPEGGDYWVVIMNADLTPGVDVDTGVGVRMPFLSFIGQGILLGGIVCLAIGGVIVYVGAVRRD